MKYKGVIFSSEEDYVYLAKSIIVGVGLGVLIGILIRKIILTFAIGGVIGILYSFIYFIYRIVKRNKS